MAVLGFSLSAPSLITQPRRPPEQEEEPFAQKETWMLESVMAMEQKDRTIVLD
jgi:hypothetical protein